MTFLNDDRGISLIAAIFIIVVLAFMGVMFVSLINTSTLTAVNELQSAQALYVAEGGVEYILANQTFPNYSTAGAAIALGSGSFSIATPSYLTADPGILGTTINVSAAPLARFPAAGRIGIDSEIIAYTGWSGSQFTGATRGVGGTTATAHAIGNAVYPVTTVSVDPGAGGTTISVASTAGFDVPGIISIGSENIYCTTLTPTTFSSCTRGYKTTAAAHPAGSSVFQYVIASTGTVGSAQRSEKVGVGYGGPAGIAFDASSSTTATTNSFSWTHPVSGNQCILLVGISIANTGLQVNSVTYNGAPLSRISFASNAGNARVEIWYLVAPTLGSNTVSVTLSGATDAVAGAFSFSGVDQTNPFDGVPGYIFDARNNPASVSITTVTNNAWVIDTLAANFIATVGGGQAEQWNISNGITGAGSTKGPIAPAGTTTMSWTVGPPRRWALGAVALKPSAGGGISPISWQEVID
jgi:hypothetical protein